MTTGVRFSEEYTDPYSDIGRLDVADGWKPIPPDTDPQFRWPHHIWELIETLTETLRPHGALFVYRSIETDVLAFAMERVTGKRLPQLVSEELWQKIGVEESANLTVDPAGYALADGGFNACLRDYARFGQLYLDHGKVDGVEVIPAAWVEATRNGDHTLFREPYTFVAPAGRLSQSVLDRGSAIALAHGARRLRPTHLCQLGSPTRRREALELAGFSQCELQHRDIEGHSRHRCRALTGEPS